MSMKFVRWLRVLGGTFALVGGIEGLLEGEPDGLPEGLPEGVPEGMLEGEMEEIARRTGDPVMK